MKFELGLVGFVVVGMLLSCSTGTQKSNYRKISSDSDPCQSVSDGPSVADYFTGNSDFVDLHLTPSTFKAVARCALKDPNNKYADPTSVCLLTAKTASGADAFVSATYENSTIRAVYTTAKSGVSLNMDKSGNVQAAYQFNEGGANASKQLKTEINYNKSAQTLEFKTSTKDGTFSLWKTDVLENGSCTAVE